MNTDATEENTESKDLNNQEIHASTHPDDVESQNTVECVDANEVNSEQFNNPSNFNDCNDVKSDESTQNLSNSNSDEGNNDEKKQNHSHSKPVDSNENKSKTQNHSHSKSVEPNQNKSNNQNNAMVADKDFADFFDQFSNALHKPPRKKRKSSVAGIPSKADESETPRKRRRLTRTFHDSNDIRQQLEQINVPTLTHDKDQTYRNKRSSKRYYDIDAETREKMRKIFNHFTEEEAREELERLIRLIDDPHTEERARMRFRNTLVALIECCREKNDFIDICKKVYDKQIRNVVNGKSFIERETFKASRSSSFHYLGQTTVGKMSCALARYFNADYNVVLLPLLAFTSTFLCHVTMKTSAKFDTNCNIYVFVVANPGAKKSPVTNEIKKYADKTIKEVAALCEKNGHYWIKGILHCIQSANCSLSRNCQLTEQASGIQLNVSDELAHASGTFQLNKKADESEDIAFLTTAYDCKDIRREFCDAKYISCIPRAYMSMIVLSQPHLIKAFLSGIKAQMGYCSRNLISFSNVRSTATASVRYMDNGQLSLWQSKTIENVLDSTFKSLGVLLFSNLISPKSKLILKYSKECALIMVAFDHLWQKFRDEYTRFEDSDHYDDDFPNSLSKGLTQVDKIIANLFFYDEFATNPIPNTYKMDDQFYKQHCVNGGYNDKTYVIKNTTLLYAGMEILIDAKISELNVKCKAIPWINFDVHHFLQNKVFVNNEAPERIVGKYNQKSSEAETAQCTDDSAPDADANHDVTSQSNGDESMNNAGPARPHLPSVNDEEDQNISNESKSLLRKGEKSLNAGTIMADIEDVGDFFDANNEDDSDDCMVDETSKKGSYKTEENVMSLLILFPGTHVNLSYIRTGLRYTELAKKLPITWKYRDAFERAVTKNMAPARGTGYHLGNVAAILHKIHKFGFLVTNSNIPGSKLIYVKPDITDALNDYLVMLTKWKKDSTIKMDAHIRSPLTKEILNAFYVIGCAPSAYIEEYKKDNIYSAYKNNKKLTMDVKTLFQQYEENFDYHQLMKNKGKMATQGPSPQYLKASQEKFNAYDPKLYKASDGKTDIHTKIYSLERDYIMKTKGTFDADDGSDDEHDIQKQASGCFIWPPIFMSRKIGSKKFEDIPKEIEAFFDSNDGKQIIRANIDDKKQEIDHYCKKYKVDPRIMEFAENWDSKAEQTNPNPLHKKGQIPAPWAAKTPRAPSK